MIQEIVVVILVAGAVSYAGFRIYKRFRAQDSICEECPSDCSGCDIVELKKEIEKNKDQNHLNNSH